MKTNYHTHTYRCKHAMGNDERYVEAAISAGIEILGFSDHTPWPHFPADYDSHVRMEPMYLPEYCQSVRRLREKYKGQIQLHLGLEAEYFPRHMQELMELKEQYGIEYLIFGAHYDEYDDPRRPERFYYGRDCTDLAGLQRYEQNIIPGIEARFYAYVAHPDLFLRCYPYFDEHCAALSRRICETAVRCGAVLEYNISGFPFAREHGRIDCFPHPEFWRIAKDCGVTAIIGYDAHSNTSLKDDASYRYAVHFLDRLGIRRLEKIEL